MADFDEELKRQAAISSLLARDDSGDSYAASMAPEVIKPDTQEDYHKLIDQAFPSIAEDQPEGPPKLAPTPIVPGLLTDPESGSRYVKDPTAESGIVPYAEPATSADEAAFKPGDVTLPKSEVLGPAPRAQLIDPDPDRNYFELNQADKPVPGFVPGSKNAIVNPAAGVVPPTPKPAYPDRIVTPEEASGTKSVVNAPAAAAAAPAPAQTQAPAPASTQAQVDQPASNDDYNKLMDSVFPSTKPAEAAGDAGSAGTLEAGANNHVNPNALFSYLQGKFANSPLIGYVPPDGARWGIKTGSAAEWAAFGLAVAKQESGFNTTSYNASDPGGSVGLFQFGQGQTQFTKGADQFNPQASADAFVRSVEHYANGGSIANMGETFGSIRRPNEAGQYIPWAQDVAANAPAQGATAAASAKDKMPWDSWTPLSPADQAAAEKEGQDFRTQQVSSLDKLNRDTPNPKQFWDKLQQPIEGVTDAQRQAYADNFKKEVTAHALDFYGEKDPEKAFTKAISDPGLDAYITNIGRGLAGAVGQADIGIALAGKSIDRNRVEGFMNLVHPDSTGDGRAGFVKALTDIQDKNHRHDVFNELYGALPQNTKDAIGDPASILDSIDNLADPARQADLNKQIAQKKAWVDQQLAGSPELKGTGADWWTTGTGENLFNTVAALVPGGVGAVVRTTTLGSQMYSANMDRIAKEHPDYSPEQVSEEASKSAFMTLAPQEAVLAASHGLTAPLLKWAGSLAEKPIVRFGIGGGVQVAAAGAGGALGQVGANVAENKPLLQDVPQAAGSAAVQSLPFAVHGGLGALGHEPAPVETRPAPIEHAAPAEPARTEPARTEPVAAAPPVSTERVAGPPPSPPPGIEPENYRPTENRIARGIKPQESPTAPVTAEDILGSEPTDESAQFHQGDVLNIVAKNVFPDLNGQEARELADRASLLSTSNLETDRFKYELRKYLPADTPTNFGPTRRLLQAYYAFRDGPSELTAKEISVAQKAYNEARNPQAANMAFSLKLPIMWRELGELPGQAEIEQARRVQAPQAPADLNTAIAQQRAAAGLRETPRLATAPEITPPREGPVPPVHVSESEPFTSKIANRYTAERMASGELGQVDPSQGKSTEELISKGVQMSPDQRERLINNFTRGVGGDLDNQGAAIRSKEALLSVQSSEAARAAEANPTNQQLKAEAEAALKAVTDFHNGPVKKFKRVWSDSGRGLQREIPLDYSTLNGMREAYMKGQGNGKAAPPEMEPALKETAARVKKSASDEEAAINSLGEEIGKRTRGKPLPSDESIRAKLMKIMNDLPCRT